MRRLVLLMMFLFASRPLFAFCLEPQLRVDDEYFISDIVFTGEVIATREGVDPQDPTGVAGTYYRLRIDRLFRGNRTQDIILYSENSSDRFPMDKGRRYLVFANKVQGLWVVDSCGNSGLLRGSVRKLQAVEKLPRRGSGLIYGKILNCERGGCDGIAIKAVGAPGRFKKVVTSPHGAFQFAVPPGQYRVTAHDTGPIKLVPFELSYKDPQCVVVPQGGSAGVAFMMELNADKTPPLLYSAKCPDSSHPAHSPQ